MLKNVDFLITIIQSNPIAFQIIGEKNAQIVA